jgi:hypothetical protein
MAKTFKEILDGLDPEDKKVAEAEIDRRITSALKTYQSTHPAPDVVLDKLSKRVDKIEKAKAERENQYELKVFAIEKCFEKKVPFNLVNDLLPLFKDQESLSKKIDDLAVLSRENDLRIINEQLINHSYKPKAGNYSERGDGLDEYRKGLSSSDLLAFNAEVERSRRR